MPGQESGAASGHCGPSLTGDIDAAWLALKLPVDQEHRIAPDNDYVGEIVGGKTGNDLGGLASASTVTTFSGAASGPRLSAILSSSTPETRTSGETPRPPAELRGEPGTLKLEPVESRQQSDRQLRRIAGGFRYAYGENGARVRWN